MRKFLAVVKREYLKLVWTWTFLVGTLLAPLLGIGVAVVPALIFSIEGEATRIAVVDQSNRLFDSVKTALNNDKKLEQRMRDSIQGLDESQQERTARTAEQVNARFIVEKTEINNSSIEQIRRRLNEQLREQELDAYIIIPSNFEDSDFEFYARNTSDFVAQSRVERALNEAVREVRLTEANISQSKLDEINREVQFNSIRVSDEGEAEDSGESFFPVFIVGLLIYLVLVIYGQTILGAVVEEKETRIAEILFSSTRPFILMMGKLVGVGLVALTQLAIWVGSGAILAIYGVAQMEAIGMDFNVPNVSLIFIIGLFVFFLLGFFTYATIYALIGSMVTTTQEGAQLAFPPILLLMIAFYCSFPVIRSPNSTFAIWTSLVPFFSPLVMPVRMAINMPPLWQIAVAILLEVITILSLTWLAAKTYRIGMLMYGKRATIPEVLRWIRQQ